MKNLELFFQLETDYEPLRHTEQLSPKTNQIISFTFTNYPYPITIQYTEHTFLQYEMEKRKLIGAFFLDSQPFQLFHFSQKEFNNNLTKTEPVPVDSLPCTALISNIKKSNYQLDLFPSESDPDVFSWHWSDGITNDDWIFYWLFYGVTYWFDLKNLIVTCKTLSEKKQKKQTGLLTELEIQSKALNYVNKMCSSNAAKVICLERYQSEPRSELSWSAFIDPCNGGDTYIRMFLNQKGKVLRICVE